MSQVSILCAANPSESHHYRYIKLLTEYGVGVHLVNHGSAEVPSDLRLASSRRWPRSGYRLLRAAFGPASGVRLADRVVQWRLARLWRRRQPALCHVHWIDERAWYCARAGLRPLVLTAYGSDLNWTRLPDHDPLLLRRKAEALASCDLLIADSEDIIALASELAGRPLTALLLPIGVDTKLFRAGYQAEADRWRTSLGIPPQATLILSPRLLRRHYRHEVVLRAFARDVARERIDAYLVFKKYLADDAYVAELVAIAGECGVKDRIRVIEEVEYEQLPWLYAAADFTVNFPAMDAFPVTFLECAACELPVLSNLLPAYRSNGLDRFLTFTDGDGEAALGRAMVDMCRTPPRARAREARARVVEQFDESCFAAQLVAAYERLAAGARDSGGRKRADSAA